MRRRTRHTVRHGRRARRGVREGAAASPTSRGPGRSGRAKPRSDGESRPPCGRVGTERGLQAGALPPGGAGAGGGRGGGREGGTGGGGVVSPTQVWTAPRAPLAP